MPIGIEQLRKLYSAFDPDPVESDLDSLYVDLSDVRGRTAADSVARQLELPIRLASAPTCQLLTGHRGSGKSTELQQLKKLLEAEKWFVVYCQADEDIERNDVDFPEVLVAVIRQTAAQLAQLKPVGITLKPGYFRDRWESLKDLLGREVSFDGLELEAGFGKISAAIRAAPNARAKIRKLLEPDTANWLHAANDVLGVAKLELQKKGFRDLVVIVDDLDKMILRPHDGAGCSTAEYLFIHRHAQMSAFKCHVVYTVPLALAYSLAGNELNNLYGQVPVVPMTKVRLRPPESGDSEPGFDKFRTIISNRLTKAGFRSSEVFTDAVRDSIIRLSGGQPRELMHLVRDALVSRGLPISDDSLKRLVHDRRNTFRRQLRKEHWPIIDQVRRNGEFTRDKDNDPVVRELLDSRAIIQYVNADEWFVENPFIKGMQPPQPS